MSYTLVDTGEEHFVKNGLIVSMDFGVYSDATDSISETNDLSDIGSEPTGSAYARQTTTPSASDESGDWGFSLTVTFDTSDSTATGIDGTFSVVNFTSSDAGDSSANDHLHSTHGPFDTTRDLSNVDTLEVTITVTVT